MEGVPSSFIPTCFLGFYGGLDLSLEASRRVHHKSPNLVAYVHFLGDYAADLLRIADFFTRAIWGYIGIILGHPGAILGPSWGHLGVILGHLGASLSYRAGNSFGSQMVRQVLDNIFRIPIGGPSSKDPPKYIGERPLPKIRR